MSFRVATLNLEQDEKRWAERRELVSRQLKELRPDVFTVNEIAVNIGMGHWLERVANEHLGANYTLTQHRRPKETSPDAEGILTRYGVSESSNFHYHGSDSVALVTRLDIEGREIDVYVTHLLRSLGDDSVRQDQVRQLLQWIATRDDVPYRIVCGDFNATIDKPSAQLMANTFQPTQNEPTAFTPLKGADGEVTHPYWQRLDRCIDFIWVAVPLKVLRSGICFNKPAPDDLTLWPSDHVGVWADLEF